MTEPIWIDLRTARTIQQIQQAIFSKRGSIRDQGFLETAIAAPRTMFTSSNSSASLFEIAASYAYHLTKRRTSVRGDNCVALVICLTFLRHNGIVQTAPPSERYIVFHAFAAGSLTMTDLAKWLQEHSRVA